MTTQGSTRSRFRWGWHSIVLLVLASEVVFGLKGFRSAQQLEAASWQQGEVESRLEALHRWLCRGLDPSDYGTSSVKRLLADPDLQVREFAFSNEVCRLFGRKEQERYLMAMRDKDAHYLRCQLLYRTKVGEMKTGSQLRLSNRLVRLFLAAVEGQLPTPDELRLFPTGGGPIRRR
jgi:hypothetical protein